MARKKNFGAPVEDVEPLEFTLFEETFKCRPQLQGATLLTYSKRFASEDLAEVNAAFLDFFESALKTESYKAFKAVIESEDKIVNIETLGEIAEWLIEEYTDRPTEASKDS
jgi:hypothetical protein